MAIITKIRERAGTAVAVIAVSMTLFILGGDLIQRFGSSSQDQYVGYINGEGVSYTEFNNMSQQIEAENSLYGREVDEAARKAIRQQAWERIVFHRVYRPEFAKLGLQVTEDEIVDMIQGNNLHEQLQSIGMDESGKVDLNRIKQFLAQLKDPKADQRQVAAFRVFEQNLAIYDRPREKYLALLLESYYVTDVEAKEEYLAQNNKAEMKYLYVSYALFADSLYNPSKEELERYYNEHKERYKREKSAVDLEYVLFSFAPSAADIEEKTNEMKKLAEEFAKIPSKEDTAFVYRETNQADESKRFVEGNLSRLPAQIPAEDLAKAQVGSVLGPYRTGTKSIAIYKICAALPDDSVAVARASHILKKFETGEKAAASKIEAKKAIDALMARIQKGEDFAELAKTESQDGSAPKGGDLGFFDNKRMVKPFSDAVFAASKEGVVNRIVETEFGYHIINVTSAASKKRYRIGIVEDEITPGEDVRQAAYQQAVSLTAISSIEALKDTVNKNPVLSRKRQLAPNTSVDADKLNNFNDPEVRQIIQWAAKDETEVNAISTEIFSIRDNYVVAYVTAKYPKGYKSLSEPEVENQVRVEVIKEMKAKEIMDKLNAASGSTLEDKLKAFADKGKIEIKPDARFKDFFLPGIGSCPATLGVAFNLKNGEISKPIKDETAVVIVQMVNMVPAVEIADYQATKQQLLNERTRISYQDVDEALKELYTVENQLFRFF